MLPGKFDIPHYNNLVKFLHFHLRYGKNTSCDEDDNTKCPPSIMVINLLLENGADINKPDKYLLTPLHHAAMRGNVEIVDRLLDNEYIDISKGDIQGSTALHIAATYNHPEIERLLLKAGASVSTKDKGGQNVLHRAAQEGNFRCSEALVEGLEQNELEDIIRDQDEDGSTPLILAVGSGDERVVALLLEKNDQKLRNIAPTQHYNIWWA